MQGGAIFLLFICLSQVLVEEYLILSELSTNFKRYFLVKICVILVLFCILGFCWVSLGLGWNVFLAYDCFVVAIRRFNYKLLLHLHNLILIGEQPYLYRWCMRRIIFKQFLCFLLLLLAAHRERFNSFSFVMAVLLVSCHGVRLTDIA